MSFYQEPQSIENSSCLAAVEGTDKNFFPFIYQKIIMPGGSQSSLRDVSGVLFNVHKDKLNSDKQ